MKVFVKLYEEFVELFKAIIMHIPGNFIGNRLRHVYFRRCLKGKVGEGVRIKSGFYLVNRGYIEVGKNFLVGRNVTIMSGNGFGIIIGDNVNLPDGCYLRDANHSYYSFEKPMWQQSHCAKKVTTEDGREASIVFEDDILVGARCIFLSGTKIGTGSVICAGSVIAHEIPPYSIVAGNPARVIANRKKMDFSKHVIMTD